MKLLLDTHIILWALNDDPRFSAHHRTALDGEATLVVSAVSVWEISIKRALGKLSAPDTIVEVIRGAGCVPLAITWDHGDSAGRLPPHHADPFDRLLIAQAQAEAMPIVTADKIFQMYDVDLK